MSEAPWRRRREPHLARRADASVESGLVRSVQLTLRMSRGPLPVERASGLPLELLHEHAHLGGLSQHLLQRQPELAAERAR